MSATIFGHHYSLAHTNNVSQTHTKN